MTKQNTDLKAEPLSIEQRKDRLMHLSDLIYKFIDVKRATMRHNRSETDGEHTLHLQVLAVSYAMRYYPELDVGKISLYAMVHDFVEVFAGDVNSLTASSDQLIEKELAEAAAYVRLKGELGESWPGLIQLVHDYELFEDPESRFVKLFDKCDPAFAHIEDRGVALRRMEILSQHEFNTTFQATTRRLKAFAEEFPDIMAIRESLGRQVASTARFAL